MGTSQKSVKEFALIGFILLAVLFGMQIMSFIFGNLGQVDFLDDDSITVTNESGLSINTSAGSTIAGASVSGFNGGVSATAVWANATINATTTYLIPSANYSMAAATGTITNASIIPDPLGYGDINVSYTYNRKPEAQVVSESTTNDSLRAIGNYANQSGTQFTTLGIAITLVVLVAVFLFFWKAFMGTGKKGKSAPGSFA